MMATARRRLLRLQAVLNSERGLDVRDYSREVYGPPSERLQLAARRLLAGLQTEPGQEVSRESTRGVLIRVLQQYGLSDWSVKRLAVHEVRSFNGTRQPLSPFESGWPGYETTKESLAVYAELHTGLLSPQAMLNYDARVLAVASLDRGRTFRD